MKKIYIFIIMILLFPMFVYAEDNNLVLKSITLEKLSENVEELSPARIENGKINLDLKMYEVGDIAEYIVVIDKSTVIEKNSEKAFKLKVKYQNEVEKGNFFSTKFKDTSNIAFMFNNNSSNPKTKRNIVLFLIVITTIFLAF